MPMVRKIPDSGAMGVGHAASDACTNLSQQAAAKQDTRAVAAVWDLFASHTVRGASVRWYNWAYVGSGVDIPLCYRTALVIVVIECSA